MSKPLVYVALQQFCEADDQPRRALVDAGCEVRENTLGRRLRREEMADVLRDAQAVLAGVEPYDDAILEALPSLRCISRCGTGTDAIDVEVARRLGITVYTTPDEVVEPVAQLTMAMILALARSLPQYTAAFHQGQWKRFTGVLLAEWTVGLVGFGRIGRAVERHLRGFGPRVLVADPHLRAADLPPGVEMRALDRLLAEADLVSLHANRPKADGPLMGPREFARMKPGSYLVNTARGFLVDEPALYDAVISGRLAGAALDVFEQEPFTGPLTQLPQVLCTPHVASLTRASRAAMERRCAQNVLEWLARSRNGG